MDSQELANALFGASRIENTSPKTMTTLQGVAVSDSADGKVKVKLLNAESVPEENDATEENTVVELMTTPAIKEGDTVVVTAEGGVLKTMSVTGNYGSGDKQATDTEEAKKVATNYIDIDENKGITVGNMQESTLGHNTYIDANGVSIRDGETVLASFEDDEIALGKNSTESSVSLCGGNGNISYSDTEGLVIKSSTPYASTVGTMIRFAPSSYTMDNIFFSGYLSVAPDALLYSSSKSDSKNKWDYRGQYTLESGKFTLSVGGHSTSDPDNMYSELVTLGKEGLKFNNGTIYGETVLYNNTTGTTSTVTLSESAANFSYLEIFYNTNKNAYGSVKVYSPNGKTAQLCQTYWSGGTATTQTNFVAISISGTTLSHGTEGYFLTTGTTVRTGTLSTPHFYITRVVGIK